MSREEIEKWEIKDIPGGIDGVPGREKQKRSFGFTDLELKTIQKSLKKLSEESKLSVYLVDIYTKFIGE